MLWDFATWGRPEVLSLMWVHRMGMSHKCLVSVSVCLREDAVSMHVYLQAHLTV